MITPFSTSRIYRAVGVMVIMMIVAGGVLLMLHIKQQTIVDSVDTHANEDTRIADLIRIARLADDNKDLVATISNAFQSATDTVAVIESIEALADAHNVELTINKAEKVVGTSNDTSLAISAEAVGSWAAVYRFVQSLDMFSYKHTTNRINFNKNKEEGTWVVTVEMNVLLTPQ
ncbi:MAG: hypothetical protein RLY57_346 [Candidatus Parcubacteria bacterium]